MSETANASLPSDREIVITRVYDAPRELVWKAWTELEHVAKWWGPQGFTTTTQKRELKPGGVWRYIMHGPDGRDYQNIVTFLEVVPPERLTYKHGGAADTEPINFQSTVTFEDLGGNRTRLTLRSIFPSQDARDFVIREVNAVEGGKQHLGRLAEHLRTMATESTVSSSFVITRVFPVSHDEMWRAWTESAQLKEWFGPKGVTISQATLDVRPGGMFHHCMRGPEGNDMWNKWTFHDIAKPDRLEFVVSFSDEKANAVRAFFDANWPLEMRSVVTFAPHAGIGRGTVVRVEWTAPNATDAERRTFDAGQESMKQGWSSTFDSLAEFFAAKEIVSTRLFDAPRAKVFRAFSDPDLLARWWGPNGFTNTIEEFDLRPGGAWRVVMHGPDGTDHHNVSEFLEIEPDRRIVFRHGKPIHQFQMTMTFADEAGQTRLTWRMVHDTVADADKVRAFVPQANEQNFDRLAEVLKTMN